MMKNKDIFNFAGCCVIAVAIIISGYMIASKVAQIPRQFKCVHTR